jgi:hypothetical protein
MAQNNLISQIAKIGSRDTRMQEVKERLLTDIPVVQETNSRTCRSRLCRGDYRAQDARVQTQGSSADCRPHSAADAARFFEVIC